MSMLTRAASKFDVAFSALPESVRQRIALAMYRAAPAMEQYQRDLGALLVDPSMKKAVWDLIVAVAWQVVKPGSAGIDAATIEEVANAAPVSVGFLRLVGAAISGTGPIPVESPARPVLTSVP